MSFNILITHHAHSSPALRISNIHR